MWSVFKSMKSVGFRLRFDQSGKKKKKSPPQLLSLAECVQTSVLFLKRVLAAGGPHQCLSAHQSLSHPELPLQACPGAIRAMYASGVTAASV